MAGDYKLTHTGAELDNAIKAVSNGVYKSSIYVPTGTADNLTFTLTDADTVDKTYGSTPISFGNIKGATGANGKDGVSITSITSTREEANKRTKLNIALSEGNPTTFYIPDGIGIKGDKGDNGINGVDGKSYKLAVGAVTASGIANGEDPKVVITERGTTTSGNVVTTDLGFDFKIPAGPQGEKGEPLTYSDLTSAQKEELSGPYYKPSITEDGWLSWTRSDGETINLPASYKVKGEKGDKGDRGEQGVKGDSGVAAGFGTPIINVKTTGAATPTATVAASGVDTAKVFIFTFNDIKGAKGDKGEKGDQGAQGEIGPQGPKGEKGPKGERGDIGATGKGLQISGGPYIDITALKAAVPDPVKGDIYLVGSVQPYELYENNGTSWINLGQLQGAKGDTGAKGEQGEKGETGSAGADGATFTPSVSETGVISWSNNKGLTNPISRNIKGPKGDQGETGPAFTYDMFTTEQLNALKVKGDKGDKGDAGIDGKDGAAAGFGTPTANVDANVGTPSVTITATGTNTSKVFDFAFKNLKGQKGEKGDKGVDGTAAGFGIPTATVDANVGIPSVSVTASGANTEKVFNFAFKNLKGVKGDKGAQGEVGPKGDKGIYVGSTAPTDSTVDVWVDTGGGADATGQNLSINGKLYNGSAAVDVGVIGAAYGGSGKTTLKESANVFIQSLDTASSTPQDADYYISQYAGGGDTTKTYHRRSMSALWTYIKSKIPSWALATSKPTYTATEVGAEVNGAVSTHNSNKTAHSALFDNKVDKVTGKKLSTNDYTTEEKDKLSGIETGAQKNVQADWNATSGTAQILNKPTIPNIYGLTLTIPSTRWVNNSQTINVNGITEETLLESSYAPESRSNWIDADVYCSAQGNGTLTYTCETVPAVDLIANVIILG